MHPNDESVTLSERDILTLKKYDSGEIEENLASGKYVTLLAITSDDKIVVYYSGDNKPEDEYSESLSTGSDCHGATSKKTLSLTYSRCCCQSKDKRGIWLGSCCCGDQRC